MMAGAHPLLLGHRGARATTSIPENTLASFDLCLRHGCDGFEFDVRGTADGLVVCHDSQFRGVELVALHEADLAAWRQAGFLPSLAEVLQRFGAEAFLDIEIKDAGLERALLSLLRDDPPRRGFVVTSFLPEVLLRLRELDPRLELGFLWEEPTERWRELPVSLMLPRQDLLDVGLAAEMKAAGKRMGAWTVNEPSAMRRLAELGVDMLIADDTAGLVNAFPVS